MKRRWVVAVIACLLGATVGCGGNTTTSAPDPADATSCADLADKYVEINGELIDQIGDRTDAEMQTPPEDLEDAAEEWYEVYAALIPRIGGLCNEGEFDELLCERRSGLQPKGEAGQRFLRDNYPDCPD